MVKYLLISCVFSLLVFSCKSKKQATAMQEDTTNLDQCFPFIENDSLYKTSQAVAIDSISWSGPCLVLHPAAGFCDNNAYRLVFSPVVRKSSPVQLHAMIIQVKPDPCDKPNAAGLAYNLTQIKQKWGKTVMHIQGYDKNVLMW